MEVFPKSLMVMGEINHQGQSDGSDQGGGDEEQINNELIAVTVAAIVVAQTWRASHLPGPPSLRFS